MSQLNQNTAALRALLGEGVFPPNMAWEIISSTTVAEGDNIRYFRYDGKLSDFMLYIEVPANATTISGGVEIYKATGFVGYNYLGQFIHTTGTATLVSSARVGGVSVVECVFNNNTSDTSQAVSCKSLNRATKYTNISDPYTRVSFYANGEFPVGTRFELRGVRADA